MREVHAAIERFDMAIARLESALEARGATAAPTAPAAPDDPAGLIDRLKRENEALRAARAREAELRSAALRRVDVAIAALEAALSSRVGGEAVGRSRAIFGDGVSASAAETPDREPTPRDGARDGSPRGKQARPGRAAAG